MTKIRKKTARTTARTRLLNQAGSERQAFIAHIHELRRRLFYIAATVGLFAGLAYMAQDTLTKWLLSPAGNQKFIYTTPGGGFDFLFKLCLYSGLAASIPIIVYHFFRYIHPLLQSESKQFLRRCTFWSSVLAAGGIAFGYFFGLPSAMRFLLQGFSSEQISALITIQSYMSFVLVYLLGSALLFQIPIILILINRIRPLRPKTLMKQQRWVILGAFIIGAMISPTPDIRNQVMLSAPVILMYEASVAFIWFVNRRKRRPGKILTLLENDIKLRARRQSSFEQARLNYEQRARQSTLDRSQRATYNST